VRHTERVGTGAFRLYVVDELISVVEPGTRVAGEWWALGHYPLWYVTVAAYLVIGFLLLLGASRAINPLRKWV